jgi:hypothetical protein
MGMICDFISSSTFGQEETLRPPARPTQSTARAAGDRAGGIQASLRRPARASRRATEYRVLPTAGSHPSCVSAFTFDLRWTRTPTIYRIVRVSVEHPQLDRLSMVGFGASSGWE